MKKIRTAVVGVGHLGRHHARILSTLPGVELVGVSDSCAVRCAEVAAQLGVPAYEDYRPLIRQVDAASIAVPTCAHFEVAAAFLSAGKPLLIEKPLTADLHEADRLLELALQHGAMIQVGHIEQFNPVLAGLPHPGRAPRLIETHRVGPYSFRSTDIGAVFDLMIHDLDLVLSLVTQPVVQVRAAAHSIYGGREDVASAWLSFEGGAVAHLFASRAGVLPQRRMVLHWDDSYAELDFAAQRSLSSIPTPEFHQARAQDGFTRPRVTELAALRESLHTRYFRVTEADWSGQREPLARELEHFVDCVRTGADPIVNGRRAREAVRVATLVVEAARQHRPQLLSEAA